MSRELKLALALIVLAAVLAFIVPAACQRIRSQAAQARLEHAQSEALSNSAADAISTVSASGARETASEDLTRSNERNIRDAPGAGDVVNAGVISAGMAALCRRAAYRDDPRCKGEVR